MGLLRAVERKDRKAIRNWIIRSPDVSTFITPNDPSTWTLRNKGVLREHAVELAKDSALNDLLKVQESETTDGGRRNDNKRAQIHQRLKNVAPWSNYLPLRSHGF